MQNGPSPNGSTAVPGRTGAIHRVTGETDVRVTLGLDGTGRCQVSTGVPFLDHMLHQISSHGLIDLEIQATGDTHIDDHHTNEDVGIAFGQALAQALGDRRGIHRFGHFLAPLDEALVQVALDCSGRPHLSYGLVIPAQKIGTYDTELVKEFTSSRPASRPSRGRCAWPPSWIRAAAEPSPAARGCWSGPEPPAEQRPPACSAPQVPRQAGRGEQETSVAGDGRHGAGIGGCIKLLLEGGIGLRLGEEGDQLSF